MRPRIWMRLLIGPSTVGVARRGVWRRRRRRHDGLGELVGGPRRSARRRCGGRRETTRRPRSPAPAMRSAATVTRSSKCSIGTAASSTTVPSQSATCVPAPPICSSLGRGRARVPMLRSRRDAARRGQRGPDRRTGRVGGCPPRRYVELHRHRADTTETVTTATTAPPVPEDVRSASNRPKTISRRRPTGSTTRRR